MLIETLPVLIKARSEDNDFIIVDEYANKVHSYLTHEKTVFMLIFDDNTFEIFIIYEIKNRSNWSNLQIPEEIREELKKQKRMIIERKIEKRKAAK